MALKPDPQVANERQLWQRNCLESFSFAAEAFFFFIQTSFCDVIQSFFFESDTCAGLC